MECGKRKTCNRAICLSLADASWLHRYDRAIWAMDDSQRELAVQRRRAWSKMPVKDGAETFFTEAKLDHQVSTEGEGGH